MDKIQILVATVKPITGFIVLAEGPGGHMWLGQTDAAAGLL